MSVAELARNDIATIHTIDCERAILTAPAALGGGAYDVPVQFVRRGMTRDDGGLAIIGDAVVLSVALSNLAAAGITDPEALKTKGWTATVGSSAYRLDACPIDYTIGVATITLKRSAA